MMREMLRIYLIRHIGAQYVQERMLTPTYCVPECQVATARDAWRAYCENTSTHFNPANYVAIGFTATGACNASGVPEFTPDWTDVTSAIVLAP